MADPEPLGPPPKTETHAVVTETPLYMQVAEVGLFLALAWVISRGAHFQPPGLDLMTFAVVLIAARSGFWPGMGAAAIACFAMLLEAGNRPADYLVLDVNRSALPAALAPLALGAAVGWVADAHRTRAKRLEEARQALGDKLHALDEQFSVVVAAKEALDRRIVGQVETITAIYEASQELESLEPEAVWIATARLTARFLDAEAVSVYAVDGFRLKLVASQGDRANRPDMVSVQEGILGTVARTGRVAGARGREEYDHGGVLLAAAMKGPAGVRGVIAIERIPFSRLTPATRQLLELIADWSGRALIASETAQKVAEEQALNPVTGVMRSSLVIERMYQEWSVARRYKLPLAAIIVRKPALLELPASKRASEALPVVLGLRKLVRDVDVMGHYRTDDSFLLVLPQTGRAGAEVLANRIQETMGGLIVVAASNEDGAESGEVLLQMLQLLAFDLQEA